MMQQKEGRRKVATKTDDDEKPLAIANSDQPSVDRKSKKLRINLLHLVAKNDNNNNGRRRRV